MPARNATSPSPSARTSWNRQGDHRLASDRNDAEPPGTNEATRIATTLFPPALSPVAARKNGPGILALGIVVLLGLLHATGLLTFDFSNGKCTVGSSAPELINRLETLSAARSHEYSATEELLETTRLALAGYSKQLDDAHATLLETRTTLASKVEQLREANAVIDQKISDERALKELMDKLQGDLDLKTGEANELSARLIDSQRETHELGLSLASTKTTLASKIEDHEGCVKGMAITKSELQTLQLEHETAKTALATLHEEGAALRAAVAEKGEEAKAARAEVRRVTVAKAREIGELRSSLAEAEGMVLSKQEEVQLLQGSLANKTKEAVVLQHQLANAEGALKAKVAELSQARVSEADAREALGRALADRDELARKLAACNTEKEGLRRSLTETEEAHKICLTARAECEDSHLKLRRSLRMIDDLSKEHADRPDDCTLDAAAE